MTFQSIRKKTLPDSVKTHFLCIKAVFYALRKSKWIISLQKSTILNPRFIFLGLQWDLADQSSVINNNRLEAILSHRVPRSTAELSSRLSTINYYESMVPFLKRVALPLYQMVKSNHFVWTVAASQAWGDLLFLVSLQLKNYIFQPARQHERC
jgi:hypothetical protein